MHERIAFLLQRYLDKSITPAEKQELMESLAAGNHNNMFMNALQESWNTFNEDPAPGVLNPQQVNEVYRNVLDGAAVLPVKRLLISRWLWPAAAAVLLISLAWWLFSRQANNPGTLADTPKQVILPGQNGAFLKLEDGSTVSLDSIQNGIVAKNAQATATVVNGRLVYSPANGISATQVFNTLHTPNGRSYKMELPDGSRVWLNAASSIRFPVAFSVNQRIVDITGEAYFEVAPNASKPFIVNTPGQQITVLGTAFNVNAYANEPVIQTTLLSGSVVIKPSGDRTRQVKLMPGHATLLSANGNLSVQQADTIQTVAWKNGAFNFHKLSLEQAMKQIERWYNVQVIYGKNIPHIVFGGEMGRDLSLEDILQFLKESNIPFKIEQQKVYIGS